MDIVSEINAQIAHKSGLDQHRDYLGISKIAMCPRAAFREYFNGVTMSEEAHRFCFAGYEQERSVWELLLAAGIAKSGTNGIELVAPWDDRLRGHIDGLTVGGDLLEIKSVTVNKFEKVRNSGQAMIKHYIQCQLYLKYLECKRAHIVYRCRETYEHFVITVQYNPGKARQYEEKARQLLEAIDANELPACECGYCKG